MSAPRMPLALRAWLLATRALPFLFSLVSRRMHARMGAAPERFAERLGHPGHKTDEPVVWLHAASLGEIAQIGPLVDRLKHSGRRILVTTTTQAGADWVARERPGILHQFAPIDTPSAVHAFLDAWDVSVAIFIEGDFGPRLTLELQSRNIPLVLLNARHSRTRARFPQAFSRLLGGFALVTCRSEQVAGDMRTLGVPSDRVRVLPDLRIATAKLPCPADVLSEMRTQIGSRPLWLAASTHPPDEDAVLAAQKAVLATDPDALLILAPRHPKRGDPLETSAKAQGLRTARRSRGDALLAETQVYLADTLGEMGVFFSLAPVAFLGGSFGDEGGHNPYEPASFGTAILSGARVENFADAYAALVEAGAAKLVQDPGDLASRLLSLIGSDQATSMGAAGQAFMDASDESVVETVEMIEGVLARGASTI